MAEIIEVDANAPDPARIARAAACLRAGGLVAFPTETVYGLGVHALDRAAVRRLFAAKGRPSNDPLIVHVATLAAIAPLVAALPAHVYALAERFWPGPLTLVLPRSPLVPGEVTAGLDTLALRVPAHAVARALIEAAGVPIAAPSANLFSRLSPTTAAHVLEDLRDAIDMVVDGGPTSVGVESTVVDLSRQVPTILRPGAISIEALSSVLGPVVYGGLAHALGDGGPAHESAAMPAPGMLSKHYSPSAPLTLYEGNASATVARLLADARAAADRGRRVGALLADEDDVESGLGPGVVVVRVGSSRDLDRVASRLYAALRQLDALGVELILARAFPSQSGIGVAVADRLRRAASRVTTID